MMRVLRSAVVVVVLALAAASGSARQPPPPGVIAASAGESVVLADPEGGWTASIPAGTVGWLFPAPGGVLYAPDLLRGRTTVIDIGARAASDSFDGVTMPHFGDQPDRYLVVAGDVLVVSYPDRALIARMRAGIDHPWQVVPVSTSVLLVLERQPRSPTETRLVAVDLLSERVVYRRPLPPGVVHMAVSGELGLLALADVDASAVGIYQPTTMELVQSLPVAGSPRDVAFLPDGRTLVAAAATAGGAGEVARWTIKRSRHGLKVKDEPRVALPAAPTRLAASPYGVLRVAAGLESPQVAVVDLQQEKQRAVIDLPAPPRDVVWCDPTAPGPIVPRWSDQRPPELEMGPVQR